jgi:tRNA uridine 5-carbamoylmethylation protein Kti12
MDKEIQDLLENEVLGDEVKTALKEAFDNKIKAMEQKLHEDYAARYSHDKAALVEAMDKMLSDSIRAELTEFAEDRSALIKQRAKLSKQTLESRQLYGKKLAEHAKKLDHFVIKQLQAELAEFTEDRKTLDAQRLEMAKQLEAIKESSSHALKQRVNKLENFVLKQLSEEIAEFQADKKALIEQRVRLARQGKKKIAEAQSKFLNRASSAVHKTLNEVIKKELVQWRDDIKVARENNFGRKIFEAVAAEYMASYLSEGTEVKKLTRKLDEQKAALAQAESKINQQNMLMETALQKAVTATEHVQRIQTLNELLAPLTREKKAVMENMLKDIKTQNLKEAFNRYLPAVVNGAQSKVTLAEGAQTTPVAKTGDRNNNQLAKAVIEESKTPDDLGVILHLAGIKN